MRFPKIRFPAVRLACVCLLGLAAASAPNGAAASAGGAQTPGAGSTDGSGPRQSAATGIPPGAEWAAWINRDIEVNLQNLPAAYSCDALWYKLHAILLAIGAREYMSIMPYNCGKGATNGGRSPTLDLRFMTLRVVTGKQVVWANTRAIHKTVSLAPGTPQRLDAADCELVQQLAGTLFAYLDTKIDSSRFECSAAASAPHFELTVRVLARWPEKPPAASSGNGTH